MGHNHGRDYKEWLEKKEKEEKLLRQLGVDEGTIQILRNYCRASYSITEKMQFILTCPGS